MLVGYPPFFSEDRMVLYQNILAGRIEFPRHVSKTARDLISKLLQVTALLSSAMTMRLLAFACLRLRLLAFSFRRRLALTLRLQADLSRRLGNLRGGSADIRKHPFFKVTRDVRWRAACGCVMLAQGFDWNGLMTRKLAAPIEIVTKGPADTSQFDD